jgi:hypothetical protein
MDQISKQPAFELGQIVATPGALAALQKAGQQAGEFLTPHVNGEWGEGFRARVPLASWERAGELAPNGI